MDRGARGFIFDDLAAAAVESGVNAKDAAAWLNSSLESGLLTELEPETLSDGTVISPQRYCLTSALAEPRHAGSHLCGDGEGNGDASRSAQRYDCPPVR